MSETRTRNRTFEASANRRRSRGDRGCRRSPRSSSIGLLTNIFQRKQEAKNPYLRLVEVTEETTDPAPWGMNWPRQYDGYRRTADVSRTQYGGSEALPEEKIERDPWLKRLFAGYAFAIDYRDRRGHAHMLADQEQTKRVTTRPQPGSLPALPRVGHPDLPAARRGRRVQGLRRDGDDAVRGRARRGGQDRLRRTRCRAAPS